MNKYRTRIYSHYVEAGNEVYVPDCLQDLENRGPTMRYVIDAFFPVDKSAVILDLGCGHGTLVHFARQAGYSNIQGVDAVQGVLKPGGRWIIHAPNGNSPFFGTIRYGDFTHEQAFTPSSLQQLLKASGFARIEFAECAPRLYGVKSAIRVILWQLIRLLYRLILTAETGDYGRGAIVTQNFYAVAQK